MSRDTSSPRRVLFALATLFAAASTLYAGIWMYYIWRQPAAQLSAEMKFSTSARALVVGHVVEGGSAQRSGLRAGDRIVAINGVLLDDLRPFYEFVDRGHPGDALRLAAVRTGTEQREELRAVLDPSQRMAVAMNTTPLRRVVATVMSLYPVPFLIVGLAVLFLRAEDPNARLLSLLFGGFIGLAQAGEGMAPAGVRDYLIVFHVVMGGAFPALFYYFFAIFPEPSPLERRAPWLKGIFSVMAGMTVLLSLWIFAVARSSNPPWLPVEWTRAHWVSQSFAIMGLVYAFGADALGLTSLVLNSLRAPATEARRKARVIVWGVVGGFLPIFVLVLVLALSHWRPDQVPFWCWAIGVLGLILIPLSFGYAVVKYRVLEIPVLLKRSARYVLVQRGFVFLTVLWGAGFTGLFASVGLNLAHVLPWDLRFTFPAVVVSAISFGSLLTLAGADVHRRVTQRIDSAFFRSAYDARQILLELAEEVRKVNNRAQLAALIDRQVTTALMPKSLAIYFESSAGQLAAQNAVAKGAIAALPTDLPDLISLARGGKPWDATPTEKMIASRLWALEPECLVPTVGRDGRLNGLLVLGPRLSEEPYSGEDKRLLASVASHVAVALDNFRLAEGMAERLAAERRAAREMEIAKEVQSKLFPQKSPLLETLEYVGGCVQAREVGGDYYDFLELQPGRTAFVLADVAGKGISAALLMANLQANLRSQYALAMKDLPGLLQSVNHLFYESTPDNRYATLFFGDYQDSERRFRYANCGHNPPVLVRQDGSIERLRATATVLGLFETWETSLSEAQICPGDTLVMFSDGVTEARSDSDEEFGEERLIASLISVRQLPVPELLQNLLATVQEFSGSEQEDDITLLIARGK